MSLDSALTKDPLQAATILAALESKNETLCRYPICEEPRQISTGTGRPMVYCQNPDHNAVNSHRARQQLRATAALATVPKAGAKQESSSPPATPPVESLRSSVVSRIAQLQNDLERYMIALAEMSDPDVAAAQIRAALDQANAKMAEAQQMMSTEQALRLAAETALLAAHEETRSERDAADQAIEQMEAIETTTQQRIEEAEQHIKEIQNERNAAIEQMRVEAQRQIEQIEQQTKETIAQAQAAMHAAQDEAKRSATAALEARAQAATAERLVSEAHISLERERSEIDRLRKELANTIEDARRRAEADRAEAQTALTRERAEIDRLREEVVTVRKQVEQATGRADTLATVNDQLRAQLIQSQAHEKEQPNQRSN